MVFKILKASSTFHAVEYNENKQAKGHAENVYLENFGHLQERSAAIKAFSSFYAIDYNENKQAGGQAEKIHHQNFLGLSENDTITKNDLKKYLEDYSARNSRIKSPQFHAILSCKGKENTFEELKAHGLELMKRLGYGNNPMLIYEHKDTNNNHIHIVTSRVGPNGEKINHNLEGKRANRILNEILKQDSKQNCKQALDKSLSYNISTVPQFKMLMEQQGYKVNDKDENLVFYRHGSEQGRIAGKNVENQINNSIKDVKRVTQIKALIHKYKFTNSPEISQNKNPNIHTSVKATYQSDLTNHLHKNLGLEFVFHGEKNKEPYGYTIIDHKNRNVFKGSEVMKLDELRKHPTVEQKQEQEAKKEKSISQDNELHQGKPKDNSSTGATDKELSPKQDNTKVIEIHLSTGIGDIVETTLREAESEANSQGGKKKKQRQRKI